MSKKITTITREDEVQTAENQTAETAETETPEQEELRNWFENMAASANILKVYRMQDGIEAYCGQGTPGSLDEEIIRKKYGGGKFVVRAFNRGRFVSGGYRSFEIYTAPEDSFKQDSVYMPPDNSGEIAALRDSLNRQQEMILRLIESHSNEKTSMRDLIEAMSAMQHLSPKAPDLTSLLPPVMDLFTKSMEIARDSGGGDSKTEIYRLIADGIKKLPEIMGAMSAVRAGIPPGYTAPGGVAVPVKTEPLTIEQVTKQAIVKLKPYAAKRTDPAIIVDWFLANLETDEYRLMAAAILNQPFEKILEADPEINQEPLQSWFRALYSELREAINEGNRDASGEDGRTTDDGGNAPVDGRSDSKPETA